MRLSRIDRWQLAALGAAMVLLVLAVLFVPASREERWHSPTSEPPRDGQGVVGLYAEIRDDGSVGLSRYVVQYQRWDDGMEYWIYSPDGGAGPCLGKPYLWATEAEAETLDDPAVPDLYLAHLARRLPI